MCCLGAFNRCSLCSELKETPVVLLTEVNSDVNVESKLCKVELCHKACPGGRADSIRYLNRIQVNVFVECHQSLYSKNATGPES